MINLFGMDTVGPDERKAIAKRELNNLLTSYADEADVFTEIIQNAIDSLTLAHSAGLYVDGQTPTLTLVIGRRADGHHYLYVADNGIGMSPEVAANLTIPGFSHNKRRGRTIGYKGVGASYFFAASQVIALRTIDREGLRSEYTVRGSYEWVKNEGEPEPRVETDLPIPDYVRQLLPVERGTGVYFQFHQGLRPSTLNNLVIIGDGAHSELRNWMAYLALKTAVGIVEDRPELGIKISAHLDLGQTQIQQDWTQGEFDQDARKVGYPFPQRVFRVGENKRTIDETPQHQKQRHQRKHQAVYYRWTADEIISDTSALEQREQEALRAHLRWVDGYLCYSTAVLKEVNQRLGGRSALLRHGIRLASDGTPQGRMLDLTLTSSQGLDRQSHIVMAFEGLELDTGRKISSDESIASAIAKIGQRVVTVLKDYRWAMKKADRPDITSDLEEWRTSVDARAQTSLVRQLYELADINPVFRVDPDNESEVIALFASLNTRGFLSGYTLQAISGYARYDSLVDVDVAGQLVRDRDDPLAIRGDGGPGGRAKVLEFKYSFEDVLSDFEEKKKIPSEIDVLVCWSVPDLNVSRGSLQPTYGRWKDHRQIYAGTHIWRDENATSEIHIIALKNVVSEVLAARETQGGQPALGTATLNHIQQADEAALV